MSARDLSPTDFAGLIAVHREQCRLRAALSEPRDTRVSTFEQQEDADSVPFGWLKVAVVITVPFAAMAIGLYLA